MSVKLASFGVYMSDDRKESRGPKKALEENIFKKGEEANCVDGHGEVT